MLIACPSCQRQLNVPDHAVGKQVRCPAPDCGTVFYVPAAAPVPTPAAPAAPAKPVPAKPAAAARPAIKPGPPAPVAPVPPTAPAPASGSPFEFGGGPVAGPEADFGFTDHTDGGLRGIGLRTRIGRAVGWLNLAAGSMVLYTLFAIGIQVGMFFTTRNVGVLAGAACAPFLLLPFPIAVVLGARMLSRTRRFGMAMAAAVVSLIVGGLALLTTLGVGTWSIILVVGATSHGMHGAAQFFVISTCGNAVLSAVVAGVCLYGGFVALRTLMNAEIKAAFS